MGGDDSTSPSSAGPFWLLPSRASEHRLLGVTEEGALPAGLGARPQASSWNDTSPPSPCLLEGSAAAAETGPRQGVLRLPSQTVPPLQPGGAQCAISTDTPPRSSKAGLLKDLLSPGGGGSVWEEGVAAAPAHSPPPFADCIWMQPQRSDLLQGRFTIPPHTDTLQSDQARIFVERRGGFG